MQHYPFFQNSGSGLNSRTEHGHWDLRMDHKPSELFDSLDLTISQRQNAQVFRAAVAARNERAEEHRAKLQEKFRREQVSEAAAPRTLIPDRACNRQQRRRDRKVILGSGRCVMSARPRLGGTTSLTVQRREHWRRKEKVKFRDLSKRAAWGRGKESPASKRRREALERRKLYQEKLRRKQDRKRSKRLATISAVVGRREGWSVRPGAGGEGRSHLPVDSRRRQLLGQPEHKQCQAPAHLHDQQRHRLLHHHNQHSASSSSNVNDISFSSEERKLQLSLQKLDNLIEKATRDDEEDEVEEVLIRKPIPRSKWKRPNSPSLSTAAPPSTAPSTALTAPPCELFSRRAQLSGALPLRALPLAAFGTRAQASTRYGDADIDQANVASRACNFADDEPPLPPPSPGAETAPPRAGTMSARSWARSSSSSKSPLPLPPLLSHTGHREQDTERDLDYASQHAARIAFDRAEAERIERLRKQAVRKELHREREKARAARRLQEKAKAAELASQQARRQEKLQKEAERKRREKVAATVASVLAEQRGEKKGLKASVDGKGENDQGTVTVNKSKLHLLLSLE